MRLHAPGRYLPIIVVPGLMGTRLSDPNGGLVWNPLGAPLGSSPGSFAADLARLSQISAELVPDEDHKFADDSKNNEVEHIKHYFNLIPDFYGALAIQLSKLDGPELKKHKLKPKVYACGYDWRQDNARSALRLAEVVEEALAETRERKVILVAHSMGGIVARYYCRVLGGESKVHQLFLIASPTLGAPTAYLQLKNGLTGIYPKDIKDEVVEGDALGAAVDVLNTSSRLLTAVDTLTKTQICDAALSFFGDVYVALCLGAGRFLSRKETTYFARQLPSIYQLLPTAIFCKEHPDWLKFDPLATGYVPTGRMFVLPTLLDAGLGLVGGALDLAGGAQAVGTQMKDDVQKLMVLDSSERTSERAGRNVTTLAAALAALTYQLTSPDPGKMMTAALIVAAIYDRADRTFLDARNNEQVYRDIYTGLLDIVEQRPLAAMNLVLAHRLDRALTVHPCPEPGKSAAGVLRDVVRPILDPMTSFLGDLFSALGSKIWDWISIGSCCEVDDEEALPTSKKEGSKKAESGSAKKTSGPTKPKPRAYIHPRTVMVYGSSLPVDSGGLLLPLAVYSNDDSNVVRSILIPNYEAASLLMTAPDGEMGQTAHGDGTVPVACANPSPALLSCAPLHTLEIPNASHTRLTKKTKTIDCVKSCIDELVAGFYAT